MHTKILGKISKKLLTVVISGVCEWGVGKERDIYFLLHVFPCYLVYFLQKHMWGRIIKNLELIYKQLYIYFYMFKFVTFKVPPFDALQLSRCCFPLLKTVLMPFSAFASLCFISSTLAKCFPLRTFFIGETKRKSHLGQDQVNREGGHDIFGQNCQTFRVVWAGEVINHPS